MSFPPNLGITNSFLIDSNCSLVFQDFPSLLPQLDQICSPFSKHRMNGYSRIKNSCRSKSLDFGDLSFAAHTPKLKHREMKLNLSNEAKIHNSIPEQEGDDDRGEVFGIILGRKCASNQQKVMAVQENVPSLMTKRSFSVRRSASISEGYSRIHHQTDLTTEDDDGCRSNDTNAKKKKGKFFRAFKRLFRL